MMVGDGVLIGNDASVGDWVTWNGCRGSLGIGDGASLDEDAPGGVWLIWSDCIG